MITISLFILLRTLVYCNSPVCYSDHEQNDLGCFEPWPLSIYEGLNLYSLCPQSASNISPEFLVYTVDQPENPIRLTTKNVQSFDAIQSTDQIVFFIHGYKNTYNDSRFISLKDELLTVSQVVIMVDYEIGADPGIVSRVTDFYNFHQAAANTQVVGRQVALMIQKLKLIRNINYNNVHLIGYSLGCSTCHFTGAYAFSKLGFQIGRITALDPAGMLIFGPGKRIEPSDAIFVDVIHTTSFNLFRYIFASSGKVGTSLSLGHVDFYPNGGGENGIDQPGCDGIKYCSHYYSMQLFKASIRRCDFNATSCTSYQSFSDGLCKEKSSDSQLGYWSYKLTGRGRYYLETSRDPMKSC
ncbi:pancreatic lipase-related protein 2-like [Panonychus citri]|uniref:pancreatic lipase-related protein 2-like n=1 Tax=Panonychus citri TaxID=50023 RepID=UPI002306F574|nr:pancreatic lipase-related protein 2-like [Panonychus citri]